MISGFPVQTAGGEQAGFTLIEILIGVLLLSLAIMTFSAALRQTYRWQIKQDNYELISITANTLINSLVASPERTDSSYTESGLGELNGIKYQWSCSPVLANRNSQMLVEAGLSGVNSGKYTVYLDSCTLKMEITPYSKEVHFYRTTFRSEGN